MIIVVQLLLLAVHGGIIQQAIMSYVASFEMYLQVRCIWWLHRYKITELTIHKSLDSVAWSVQIQKSLYVILVFIA